MSNAKETIANLKKTIDLLKEKQNEILEENKRLNQIVVELNTENASCYNQLAEAKKNTNKLNDSRAELLFKNNELNLALENIQADMDFILEERDKNINYEKDIANGYYKQLVEAKTTIGNLEQELIALREKFSMLHADCKTAKKANNDQIKSLTPSNFIPQVVVENLSETDVTQQLKARIVELEQLYSTLFKQYTAVENRESDLQAELEEIRTTSYKNAFDSATSKAKYFEQSLIQAQKDLFDVKQECLILSEELSIYKNYSIKPNASNIETNELLYMSNEQKNKYLDSIGESRFNKAFVEEIKLIRPYNISCDVISNSTGEIYTTSIDSCSCTDFKFHKKPCKHMIALALSVNAFSPTKSDIDRKLKSLAIEQYRKEMLYTEKMNKAQAQMRKATQELKTAREIKSFIDSKVFTYPYLAELISYYKTARLDVTVRSSVTKREMNSKIKQAEKENALLRNKIAIYEYMFPNLQDLKDVEPEKIVAMTDDIKNNRLTYQWLSPEEYSALTSIEKQNLFLKNYFTKRSKNAWEVGIKYERYIGYLCEKEGYKIQYTGATLRLNDMGRDLIVSKGNRVYIIQCKRHAKDKQIHENHLFQLFGSIQEYAKKNESKKVAGVFVTTTTLSDVAMECARCLNIAVYENVEFREYPLIKCNISKSKGKIYHLPYDQQYDNTQMSLDDGEFYAATIEEAEQAGFRHAHKWLGKE